MEGNVEKEKKKGGFRGWNLEELNEIFFSRSQSLKSRKIWREKSRHPSLSNKQEFIF